MSKDLILEFKKEYRVKPGFISRAPGRLEILGNHTDYNEGFVLSTAVGQATEFAIVPSQDKLCRLKDFRDNSCVEFSLDEVDKPVKGDWSNYVKGVISELRKRGHEIRPFNGAILSTVPLSAGMSSSAALEIAAAYAFSSVFGINLEKEEWARIGQGVENNFMGLQSGLLDQFSSIYGQKDSLIFCDFRTVSVLRTVPLPEGYKFVVANSMVKHDLVDSDYNRRRESCENTVSILKQKYPEIKALRDVSVEMLNDSRELLPKEDYMRSLHITGENERVQNGVGLLEKGDIKGFGELMFVSHKSSKDNFENSCPELDCLVELASVIPGCAGARLSGGGFGGISVHLVEAENASEYCERLKTAYKSQTGKETETIICDSGEGASVSPVE